MKKIKKEGLRISCEKMAFRARQSARLIASLSAQRKNDVLVSMADALIEHRNVILKANKQDVQLALRKGMSSAFVERLTLDEKRIFQMSESLRQIAALPDPVGKEIVSWERPNGLSIAKVRVPIGVILIIYESRPNVTSDCIGLCFKSGNAVILKGGSDAFHSNTSIFNILKRVVKDCKLPEGVISFVPFVERQAVDILLSLDQHIDLVMPRGGESLIKEIKDKSRIPVIKHYKGVCHIYVDDGADLEMAKRVVFNAKVQRPSVCNAIETLLVHKDIANRFLPQMGELFQKAGVEIRGCARTKKIFPQAKKANLKDWETEYLDLIISVKVVDDIVQAIEHINFFGSHHSDAIITQDTGHKEQFLKEVDSACVYANASTRFTDGDQFGFGAEIGISTDRLHARGPMGLEDLTTYKYVIEGQGQIRE
ncbi:MAG: glutamate-5-semialdehyde dehydrogenase [Candidatus Omnitrophota bacterium]